MHPFKPSVKKSSTSPAFFRKISDNNNNLITQTANPATTLPLSSEIEAQEQELAKIIKALPESLVQNSTHLMEINQLTQQILELKETFNQCESLMQIRKKTSKEIDNNSSRIEEEFAKTQQWLTKDLQQKEEIEHSFLEAMRIDAVAKRLEDKNNQLKKELGVGRDIITKYQGHAVSLPWPDNEFFLIRKSEVKSTEKNSDQDSPELISNVKKLTRFFENLGKKYSVIDEESILKGIENIPKDFPLQEMVLMSWAPNELVWCAKRLHELTVSVQQGDATELQFKEGTKIFDYLKKGLLAKQIRLRNEIANNMQMIKSLKKNYELIKQQEEAKRKKIADSFNAKNSNPGTHTGAKMKTEKRLEEAMLRQQKAEKEHLNLESEWLQLQRQEATVLFGLLNSSAFLDLSDIEKNRYQDNLYIKQKHRDLLVYFLQKDNLPAFEKCLTLGFAADLDLQGRTILFEAAVSGKKAFVDAILKASPEIVLLRDNLQMTVSSYISAKNSKDNQEIKATLLGLEQSLTNSLKELRITLSSEMFFHFQFVIERLSELGKQGLGKVVYNSANLHKKIIEKINLARNIKLESNKKLNSFLAKNSMDQISFDQIEAYATKHEVAMHKTLQNKKGVLPKDKSILDDLISDWLHDIEVLCEFYTAPQFDVPPLLPTVELYYLVDSLKKSVNSEKKRNSVVELAYLAFYEIYAESKSHETSDKKKLRNAICIIGIPLESNENDPSVVDNRTAFEKLVEKINKLKPEMLYTSEIKSDLLKIVQEGFKNIEDCFSVRNVVTPEGILSSGKVVQSKPESSSKTSSVGKARSFSNPAKVLPEASNSKPPAVPCKTTEMSKPRSATGGASTMKFSLAPPAEKKTQEPASGMRIGFGNSGGSH